MEKVYIRKAERYDEGEILDIILPILEQNLGEKITRDAKILVKPNMLSGRKPEKAVTTHPRFVSRAITALKKMGAKAENITLADSSGGPVNPIVLNSNYSSCGFTRVAKEQGVNLYTKQESVTIKTDGKLLKEFEVIKPRRESDVIISLGKFKTHAMTGMTGAVKNIFGTVPGLKKAEFHMRFPEKENFARMMVDLCLAVNPTFTLVDGILGMEGDGPAGGNPRQLGLILGGRDPFAIDLVMAGIMGFDPSELPILSRRIDRGLCPPRADISRIDGDAALRRRIPDFKRPRSYRVDFSDNVPRPLRWATPGVERRLAPRPVINKDKCIGCGQCRGICPRHTITISGGKANINPDNCIKCFCCHEMCPEKAIDIKRSGVFNI